MQKFIVNTECAIEHEGKFLIIRRPDHGYAGGLLAFPGGKFDIEDGEGGNNDAIKAAIKREVQEEVGLDLTDPLNYVTTRYFSNAAEDWHVVNIIYHCKIDKTKLEVKPSPREVPEYYWLSHEELLERDNCPHWLAKYMQDVKDCNI